MIDWAILVLMMIGAVFMFLAALGIIRLPDLYMRISASTKAATLGAAAILAGTAFFFQDVGVASRAMATGLFLFLTAPVAGHMIGRAAYLTESPLWKNSIINELEGRYDLSTDTLHSADPAENSETQTQTKDQS